MRQYRQTSMPRVAAGLGAVAFSAAVLAVSVVVPATLESGERDRWIATASTAALAQCPVLPAAANEESAGVRDAGLVQAQSRPVTSL